MGAATRMTIGMLGLLALSGCCGQLKEAGQQHATATKQVGQTLQVAVAKFDCGAIEDAGKRATCEAAVAVVKQQADVLVEAAETLTKEMQ